MITIRGINGDILTHFDNNVPEGNPYFEPVMTDDMESLVSSFSFSVPLELADTEHLVGLNQVLVKDRQEDLRLFVITDVHEVWTTVGGTLQVTCEDISINEMNNIIVSPFESLNFQDTLTKTFKNSGWALKYGANWKDVDNTTFKVENYDNMRSVIASIVDTYGCQFKFMAQENQFGEITRVAEVYKSRGNNTGKYFYYDRDLLGIERDINHADIKTAIHPYYTGYNGKTYSLKGFAPVNPDPDFKKDKDSPLIINREASKLFDDGNSYRIMPYKTEVEGDPELVYREAIKELKKHAEPVYTYSVNVLLLQNMIGWEGEDIDLGDTVWMKERVGNRELGLEARVTAYEYHEDDPSKDVVTFSNFKEIDTTDVPELAERIFIAYANSEDGIIDFSITDSVGKAYMGVYTAAVSTQSADPSTYSWTRIKGEDGISAPTLNLTSSQQVMKFKSDGTPDGNQTIIFTALKQNSTETVTWEAIPYKGDTAQPAITLGGTGDVRSLTSADWNNEWTRVQVTVSMGSLKDIQTIVMVSDGATGASGKAIVGYVTNESTTFAAASDGTVTEYGNGDGKFVLYEGTSEVTSGITFARVSQVGINLLINDTTGEYKVSNMTADMAQASISATYKGITITKFLSFSKSKQGAKGDKGDTGNDGIAGKDGIGLKSTTVTYAASTSGTTAPSTGWQEQVPSVAPDNFLWTRTVWTYTDDTSETGYSVAKMGKDGAKGNDGIAGKDGVGISDTLIEYAVSTSGTTKPTSGWSTTIPTTPQGQYLWTRTTWTYTDETTEQGFTVARMGQDGAKGNDGIAGKDGVGLKSTAITYAGSANGTTPPTTGWNTQVPTVPAGQYLWTKTVWTYTDNSNETGYSVARMGQNGNDGKDGIAGKDGVGIKDTIIEYAVSTSGMTKPTSGWSTSIPTVPQGQYLWTRTNWTYTDNTTEQGFTVARQGEKGDKGDQGIAGPKGSDGRTQYTHIAYADNANGGGFSQDPANKNYIGMYVDFEEMDSTDPSKYAWSLIRGAKGDQGTAGAKGEDGRTPYFHMAYAWSADGTDRFTTVYPKENLWVQSSSTSGYINAADGRVNVADSVQKEIVSTFVEINPLLSYWMQYEVDLKIGQNGWFGIGFYDANKVFINRPAWANQAVTKDETISVSQKINVPSNARFARISFRSYGNARTKFEQSDIATIYTPSPSDDYANAYPTYTGTYTDYEQNDSTDPKRYTWSLIKGADGTSSFLHTAWANVDTFPEFVKGARPNVLRRSENLILSSNNSSLYPIYGYFLTDDDGRAFYRTGRTNLELNPTKLTLFNAINVSYNTYDPLNLGDLTEPIVGKKVILSGKWRASKEIKMRMMAKVVVNGTIKAIPRDNEEVTLTPEWQTFSTVIPSIEEGTTLLRFLPSYDPNNWETAEGVQLDQKDIKLEIVEEGASEEPTPWIPPITRKLFNPENMYTYGNKRFPSVFQGSVREVTEGVEVAEWGAKDAVTVKFTGGTSLVKGVLTLKPNETIASDGNTFYKTNMHLRNNHEVNTLRLTINGGTELSIPPKTIAYFASPATQHAKGSGLQWNFAVADVTMGMDFTMWNPEWYAYDIAHDFTTSSYKSEGLKYLGMYTDDKTTGSQDPADYEWNLVKGSDGNDGAPAKALTLQADSPVMKFDANDVVVAGQVITFTAVKQNFESNIAWVATPYKGNTAQPAIALKGTGDVRTLEASMWASGVTTVRVDVSADTFRDSVTITKVKDGAKGDKGSDGIAGKDGVGIRTTAITYAGSASGTTPPTTGWQTQVPTVPAGQFLWTKTVWTYTDSSSETGYSVAKMGQDGAKGNDGIAGKDGVGIKTTLIEYAANASGTVRPTNGWSTTIPNTPAGQYLWTRTTWTYTDNTTEQGYTVARQGANGTNGTNGTNGIDAYSAILSNEANTFAANPAGAVTDWSTGNGTFMVYKGNTRLTSGVAYAVASSVDATGTINATTGDYTVTALAKDNGSITFKATIGSTVLTKTMTLSKARQGVQGVQGTMGIAFYSPTEPTGDNVKEGSTWFKTVSAADNTIAGIYTYKGGKWIKTEVASGALSVEKLSALSANLGDVTAGNITGVNITGASFINPFDFTDVSMNHLKGTTEIADSEIGIEGVVNEGTAGARKFVNSITPAYFQSVHKDASGSILRSVNTSSSGIILNDSNVTTSFDKDGLRVVDKPRNASSWSMSTRIGLTRGSDGSTMEILPSGPVHNNHKNIYVTTGTGDLVSSTPNNARLRFANDFSYGWGMMPEDNPIVEIYPYLWQVNRKIKFEITCNINAHDVTSDYVYYALNASDVRDTDKSPKKIVTLGRISAAPYPSPVPDTRMPLQNSTFCRGIMELEANWYFSVVAALREGKNGGRTTIMSTSIREIF